MSGETRPGAANASSSKARLTRCAMTQKSGLSSRSNVYVFLRDSVSEWCHGRGGRCLSHGRFLFFPDLVFVKVTPSLR